MVAADDWGGALADAVAASGIDDGDDVGEGKKLYGFGGGGAVAADPGADAVGAEVGGI